MKKLFALTLVAALLVLALTACEGRTTTTTTTATEAPAKQTAVPEPTAEAGDAATEAPADGSQAG